jgi:hypothetical protein
MKAGLYSEFHIHGDNIVECERTVALVATALSDLIVSVSGPTGALLCPTYEMEIKDTTRSLVLTLYPGFGRWNQDVLDLVRRRGGTLREAADAIITGVADGDENPLLAIEYCGALPAGNQAWQRSGRAISFGKAQIPYLYVAELAGYELGVGRVRKAARLPNPAVPFSYLTFSLTNATATLPVFVTSPGADESSRSTYANTFGELPLVEMIRAVMLGAKTTQAEDSLKRKALNFVETKASTSKPGTMLTPSQWEQAYASIQGGQSIVDYVVQNTRLSWSKVTSIPLTDTARQLMNAAASLAIGLTSKDLPICVIPKERRGEFADAVERIYDGRLQNPFIQWLKQGGHLTICWVMGFKPRHDDARPDRGLAPLARMLIGETSELLTVVYGPASASSWRDLHTSPRKLIVENGLWESILNLSDSILVDSTTDSVRTHGYVRSHWHEEAATPELKMTFVAPLPLRIAENDVDTVIHQLLARHCGPTIFEGLCNPPGGDWSGISLQSVDRSAELRWLTLPRVGADEAKRPDQQVANCFGCRVERACDWRGIGHRPAADDLCQRFASHSSEYRERKLYSALDT